MAQARAMTNMVGNGVATVVIARWENEFDDLRAAAVLDEKILTPADIGAATIAISPAASDPDLDGVR